MKTSFDKAKHRYLIDGKPATGVTTIIGILDKPALVPWAARMVVEKLQEQPIFEELSVGGKSVLNARLITPEMLEEARTAHTKKKEAAGAHGTDAHALVEEYINTCLLPENEGKPYTHPGLVGIEKFVEWSVENVDHFLFAERKMYNKRLFIAGTADFAYIGKDGKRYMADFKTSSGIFGIGYWLQVAGYRMLAEEEGDAPYDGATIVRMGKKGPDDFDVQQLYEYETYKEAFLCCLTLYRANAAIKGLIVK